jgi:hypothetical protein
MARFFLNICECLHSPKTQSSIFHCDSSSSFASTHRNCQYSPKPKIIKKSLANLANMVITANITLFVMQKVEGGGEG